MNFRAGASGLSRRAATVVDITALVDVVFQLLIFFLLTSSYVSQASSRDAPTIPVDVPESNLTPEPGQLEEFTIAITADGTIYVGANEEVALDELRVRLLRTADRNPNTVVLIRGDEAAAYGRIAQVMEAARLSRLRINAQLQGQ